MQIKITMRYRLTPIRIATIIKEDKCWQRCKKIEIFMHCWRECKMVPPLWETVWQFLKFLKIELPYGSAIPLLGIYPQELKADVKEIFIQPCS